MTDKRKDDEAWKSVADRPILKEGDSFVPYEGQEEHDRKKLEQEGKRPKEGGTGRR